MRAWKFQPNSLSKVRFFDIKVNGVNVHLKVKVQFKKYSPSVVEITWSSERSRYRSAFTVSESWRVQRLSQKFAHPTPGTPWRVVFKKLRTSLAYGMNVKSRAVTDRLMQANGQQVPHKKLR